MTYRYTDKSQMHTAKWKKSHENPTQCMIYVMIFAQPPLPTVLEDQTQGLMHARQTLYHQATSTQPFFFLIIIFYFKTKFQWIAQAGL
jgi:hypothetical protein